MTPLLAFGVALILTLAVTPLVRDRAHRSGLVDEPGGRKIHESPIPRLGGMVMVVSWYLALAVAAAFTTATLPLDQLAGPLAGIAVVVIFGLIDDLVDLRPMVKLVGQLAGAGVAIALGLRLTGLALPWGELALGALAIPVAVVWIVGVINAMNLIDGLDGLAGGVAGLALAAFGVLAAANEADAVLLMVAAGIGATLGFLAYNRYPASIIMGDAGSMFLGFLLAGTAILLVSPAGGRVSPLAPILALGLPLADTGWAIARRAIRGGPIFSPDAGHIHHRLLAAGLAVPTAVWILYAISAALGALAIAVGLAGR